ncbi:pre-mRNA-splicing factor 18 [Anthonomus grandis grandis]|uniref:pre-mRNA-splicing factor 18 n=1 Tax=Anthonomus grandis grandis TaxID=2921223 RepID=UPI002166C153|nr:pre-mRNA-splicing factor 18 [Anthonomus grandis grandis]
MDILKAEIEKKRKELEENVNPKRKYFRRGELTAKELEKYKEKADLSKNTETSSGNEQGAKTPTDIKHNVVPRNEVISKLRDRGEPILLFGESEADASKRLRKCELLEPEVNRGFRNDLQEAMDQVDQEYLNDFLKSQTTSDSESQVSSSTQDPSVTYDEICEMAKKMARGNREHDMTTIVHFIQLLLSKWDEQLQNRTHEEKLSVKGKLQGATYAQTQVYLKPLLRKLKSFTLPEDISDSLTEIIMHLLNRNYLKASDAYLQMAIGNAPWPIGVTMVGIHARTGREKIFSKNVAHVMNDETQRKYIQGLKRLMTKCQEYFPTDPSRCVEYGAFGETKDSECSSST